MAHSTPIAVRFRHCDFLTRPKHPKRCVDLQTGLPVAHYCHSRLGCAWLYTKHEASHRHGDLATITLLQ